MFKSLISLATGTVLAVTVHVSAPVPAAFAAEADAPKAAAGDSAKPAADEAAKIPEKAAPSPFEGDGKRATEMLFESKHIVNVPTGTELLYKFERKPSDEKILGKGYSDDIKVTVESDAAEGKKNVLVRMFTGDRARDPHRITEMDGNPMLVVYLDTALGHFRQLAGGDHGYLKDKFSKSIGKSSKLQPVKISYKGQDIEGFSVLVTPFADDPARSRMRGFENSEFTLVVSDKIPGHFAKMTANYTNSQKDGPTLLETTTLDGVGAIK